MRHKSKTLLIAVLGICLLAAFKVSAQILSDSFTAGEHTYTEPDRGAWPASDKSFGTTSETAVTQLAIAFTPSGQLDVSAIESNGSLRYCTSDCLLVGSFDLPTGVEVTGMTLDYQDADAVGGVTATLASCQLNSLNCAAVASIVSNDDGNNMVFTTASHTVDSLTNSYAVQLSIEGGTDSYGARNVTLHYQRQISPAPGTATFGDVPTSHLFFQHVEALAASGITAGCGGGDFCPDSPVTRGQIAVFLAKALGLHWPD